MDKERTESAAGRECTLSEILEARERRQETQRGLLRLYGPPIVSFTLNIPGPVKVFPLSIRTFAEGVRLIEEQLKAHGFSVSHRLRTAVHTGYECFWAVRGDAFYLKEILCVLEESLPLGRLFDADVLRGENEKISRTALGFSPRRCLLCGREAFRCGRARTHTAEELLKKARMVMEDYFSGQYARKIGSLAVRALLWEVTVTPKPGLVDRNHTGAHRDMDIFTFEASAAALGPFFEQFVLCGIRWGNESKTRVFRRLQAWGVMAEEAMLQATGRVNTHKGIIFSLALAAGALGYMYANEIPYSRERAGSVISALAAPAMEALAAAAPENARTCGERLYARYGAAGIRGEALAGYPTVWQTSLPLLETRLAEGYSFNDAGAEVLIRIIARLDDTNIAKRTSYETMKEIRRLLERRIEENTVDLIRLDQEFVRRNISPGGSADLLALTFFWYFYEKEFCG